MSKASEYNQRRYDLGLFTHEHTTTLTKLFQLTEKGLYADGKFGPKTEACLNGYSAPAPTRKDRLDYEHNPAWEKLTPLMPYYCAHKEFFPDVSSDHWLTNPERGPGTKPGYPGHQGQDWMYPYNKVHHPDKRELPADRYDGRWWTPELTMVRNVGPGVVERAEHVRNKEWCIRIRHIDGWATQHRHLASCLVKKGDKVRGGEALGLVGSMNGTGLVHLHTEVYQPGPYVYENSMHPRNFYANARW